MIDQYALNMLSVSGDFEKERTYWLQQLHGDLTPVTFPYDYTAASHTQHEMITKSYEFPQGLSEQLFAFCNHSDYGLFMTVLSAFPFVLNMYTHNTDIIVGSPVFRGEEQEAEAARLNEMLPLRLTFDSMSSFKTTMSDIKRTVMGASEHEHFPLQKWVGQLCQVVVLFDSIHESNYAQGLEPDTMFTIVKYEQTLRLVVAYHANLYKESTIDGIVRHLTQYVQAVLDAPSTHMADIDLVGDEEKHRLLFNFNDTQANYDKCMTITQLFEQQVMKTPNHVAVMCGQEQWTYQELNEKVNNLAHVLRSKGVVPNQCVGVMTDRSLTMIMSMLAILKAGGAYVPIDPAYPTDRITHMMESSGAQIIVFDPQYRANLQELSCETIDVLQLPIVSTDNLLPVGTSADLAYIIYTSGTTGRPKGVMIEHRNVVRLLLHDRPQFDFNDTDVWTMFHSYCFDFSVWEMYGALLFGGKLIIIPKSMAQDPKEFLDLLIREKVTVLNQTPSSFYHIIQFELELNQPELQLRYVIFGGEALKPAMLRPFQERYDSTKLINMYGITETTVHVTYKEIMDVDMNSHISNIGKPIPTLRCYILDEQCRLVPEGIVGELYIGGDGVARGYRNLPQLTAEKFMVNPYNPTERLYRSGDLARWSEQGELEYYGRIDHQVKIRGYRIELGEIEVKLLQHEAVQECLVIAMKDDSGQSDLIAYYVSDHEVGTTALREHLASELPDFMIPALFMHLDRMPLTVNGKVDRKALPQPELIRASGSVYVAPQTPLEQAVAGLWANVLRVEEVGVHDNFFTIGGDSIKVIRLISQLNRAQNTHLSVADFYKNPTIVELADWLTNHSSEGMNEWSEGMELVEQMKQRLQLEVANLPLPADTEDYYPLSRIQQSMVFYSKLKPDEPMYHDQFYYLLTFARFDWHTLRRTISILTEKHPILRTAMHLDRYSEPIQIVHQHRMPLLELVELSDLVIADQEQQIQAYMAYDLQNKFRFHEDLLWRLGVFQLSANDVCIVLSFHHAILDGWSVASFNKELIETYDSLLQDEHLQVKPLKASYKDYVGIQLFRSASVATEQFWHSYLEGYTRNKLPFNLAAKQITKHSNSVIYRNDIDQELLVSLDQLTKSYGFTLKEICFSAYLYVMHVMTTENDIVTGIVTHDRPAIEDGENILGCFLNTLPFRMAVDRNSTSLAFITLVKQHLQRVISNDMPLVDIAKLIGDSHHHATNPLFDALFNYTDFHILGESDHQSVVQGSDRQLELQSSEMTNTLFDLEVTRTWNQLGIQIKYAHNYFYESEIETAFNLYLRILKSFASHPTAFLQDIPLMAEEQYKQIVHDFNQTQTPYAQEKTMHRLFEEQAARTPDHVALTMDGATLTYGQLNAKANQVAAMLLSHGVRNNDHVALIADRGFDMIIGMYGILKVGAAYVPIDPEYPQARKQYISEHAAVTALLADQDYGLDIALTLSLNEEAYGSFSAKNHDLHKSSNELAYIIYTSGSTGNPKGVMIEHHSAVNLIQWVNNRFSVNDQDTLLFMTSMCFDLSVYDIFGTLACGGKIVVARKSQMNNHQELIHLLKSERITFWDSVPSTMNHLVNMLGQEEVDFVQTDLRLVFMSGDWIPVTLPERMKRFFPHASVISLGGATEATVWSNYYPIEMVEDLQSSIPYGRPMDNNYFYIVDDSLNPVPYGVAGELYIGGVGVARGYMNDVEKTTNAFVSNPFLTDPSERMYRTGDLGRMLPSGVMEFLGRKDHQVKIRGFRVELGEIESQLFKLQHIREAVVVDKLDTEGAPYLCAYVVFDQMMSSAQLRDELSNKLPGYMVPSIFIPLERLPLTSNGKIDRKSLPEPDDSHRMGSDYEAPRDPVEEQLVRIWQDVLGKERIGIRDHFFEIGGHSLLATSLALKINRGFAVDIPLLALFNYPTIHEIAEYLRKAKQTTYRQIERVENRDVYPLSYAQQRMFILNQIEGEGLHYNAPVAFIVQGRLDADRLMNAYSQMLHRHEILRTSFSMNEGSMVQHIHADIVGSIERSVCKEDAEAVIHTFVRPFDLEQAPLLRVGLVDWTDDRQLLLFDMHHMISDGVSMGILIREFIAIYEQMNLPAPRIQYRDYAVWQQEVVGKDTLQEQENYWVSRFTDELPILDVPTDFPRPSMKSFEGDRIHFAADKEIADGLQQLAKQSGSTLYMVLLAAYNVLLAKYSGQIDIVVGSPIAGRSHTDLEQMLGVFINTLAMRNAPEPDKTFEQLLLEVKANSLQAYANQDYPFEQLVERLNVRKDVSRNPLFDTMFILQNNDQTQYAISGLTFTEYPFDHKAVKFDLTLQALEEPNGIRFDLEYGTKLFKKETIERLSQHWLRILRSIIANPLQRLADIDMVSIEEKQQILVAFNDTITPYPDHITLHEVFEEQVAQSPNQIAVIFEDQQLTYSALNERSNQLARHLQEHGVKADSVVGVMAERSLEMIVGIYAILKAGGAYVPLDPEYPHERLVYMIEDSGVVLVLAHSKITIELPVTTIQLNDPCLYEGDKSNVPNSSEPSNLAYIIYTSGSTGKPKGVMVEHRSVMNRLNWMQKQYPLTSKDVLLQKTRYSFDVSVWELFWWYFAGAKLSILAPEAEMDPKQISETIHRDQVTIIHFVPSMLHLFVDVMELAPVTTKLVSSLRWVVCSGEALPIASVQRFNHNLGRVNATRLANLYGPTEATVDVTYYNCSLMDDETIIPIGKPIDNTMVFVLDAFDQLQPVGIIGELCIAGVGLARGYAGELGRTQDRFVDHPFVKGERMYRTGDLAKWMSDGTIEYMGRRDHQVKIRGFRIELSEIETQLATYSTVREVVVIDRMDSQQSKYLCAYYVSNEEVTVTDLRTHLLRKLPDYMVPSHYVRLDQMPLTPNGKLDRKSLPEPNGSMRTGTAYVAPHTAMELQLAEIWHNLLGVEKVGRHDHFFELGGHSLKAMVLTSRIHKEMGVEVPVREVFQHPVLEEQARFIQDKGAQVYTSIPTTELRAYYPVSNAQRRMFILNQLEGDGTQYNTPNAFLMVGLLDESKLTKAFQQLITRHDILRTTFTMKAEAPVQLIQDEVSFSIERYVIGHHSIEEIIQQFVRPFDLSEAPLLRVGLVKLEDNRHLLLFDMHHIISDGVTMGILVREFITFYEGGQLPTLRIQYKDYATWQQEIAPVNALKDEEAYWLSKLSGEMPVLNLPSDYMRPAVLSYEGDRIQFTANRELTDSLQQIAKRTGSTLYMVLLATYNVLLMRYTDQDDIIVGTPIAGRPHADLEGMLGVFINTLAMRNAPDRVKTFEQFLLEVKENALQAYANQDYPFEQLVEKLNVVKDISRNPLFDTMFILQNTDQVQLEIPDLTLKPYTFDFRTAKFDLTLQATEQSDGIRFDLEYSTKLFNKASIERLSKHWLRILESISKSTMNHLGAIEMVSEEERQQILQSFNDTEAPYPKEQTIHELFEEQVEKSPDQVAVLFEDQQITYRDLNERANQLAHILRERGVKPDSIVGIMTERSLAMFVGIYAILKAGGAYLPMDPEYPRERLAYMLEDSGAQLVLSNTVESIDLPVEIVQLNDPLLYSDKKTNLTPMAKSSHLAYVIYTSGSTGKPKGVIIEHHSVNNLLVGFTRNIPFRAGRSILTLTSISFDIFVMESLVPLALGMKLIVPKSERERDLASLSTYLKAQEQPVQIMQLTPSRLRMFLESGIKTLFDGVESIIVGGEAFPADLMRRLKGISNVRIFNCYGPTETTVYSTMQELTNTDNIGIGKPITNTTMYIVDAEGALQPVGVPGELCIAGAGLARGYWNRADLTNEKFVANAYDSSGLMYRTGDLARWLSDGTIDFFGRIDQQVKIRGYRIEIGEIETRLRCHPSIEECVVITTGLNGNQQLCAYYVSSEELTVNQIRAHVLHELPDYMIPSYFVQLERIPMTPNGKIDRKSLPEPNRTAQTSIEYVVPRNATEQILIEIWQEVLGIERIGIREHFFEMGGDSIKAIQIVARLQQQSLKLDMKNLFMYPTIEQLSSSVRATTLVVDQGMVEGEVALTPIQAWFFEQQLSDQHHWNQAVMLNQRDGFNEEFIARIFSEIIEHHDALRMTYRLEANNIIQMNQGFEKQLHLEVLDLTNVTDIEQRIEVEANRIQGSMVLSDGPLIKLGLFKTSEGDHLLIAIHHLVIDGVSWRILFEDITIGYQQLLNGHPIQFMEKTNSFQAWSNQLHLYANSKEFLREKTYWAAMEQQPITPLPKDGEVLVNREQHNKSYDVRISIHETEQLMKQAHHAYNTEMNDLLLTALGRTIQSWTGEARIAINMEGHGREEIIEQMNVMRTVGWFTSLYPVVLDMGTTTQLASQIKQVKETVRRIPNKGIGYGLLRYVTDEEHKEGFEFALNPEICFNYLGQFDLDVHTSAFEPSPYSTGHTHSPNGERLYALDISAILVNGELNVSVQYHEGQYEEQTIIQLMNQYKAHLLDIIRHCSSIDETIITPSDISDVGLSIEDLDDLTSELALSLEID